MKRFAILKKVTGLLTAMAMAFTMAAPAMAAENPETPQDNDKINVNITLQLMDKTGDSSDITPLGTERVTIDKGQTVKDAVNALITKMGKQIVTCKNDDPEFGCIWNEDNECACTEAGGECNCTWKRVQNVDANYDPIPGSYSSVLNSLAIGRKTYTNVSKTTDDGNGWHTYEGTSWEYYVGDNYPETKYMNQYTLDGDADITLSFTTSTLRWQD